MTSTQRWMALVGLILVIVLLPRLPGVLIAPLLALGGVYLLWYGLNDAGVIRGRLPGTGSRTVTTYWRGQRVDYSPTPQGRSKIRASWRAQNVVALIGGVFLLVVASGIVFKVI